MPPQDDIKRKISMEMDSSSDRDFSEEVKGEIESSPELREFTDDLVKIESMMENLSKETSQEAGLEKIKDRISQALSEPTGSEENAGELLSEPMPETSEEKEALPPRQPAFTFPVIQAAADETKPEKDEGDILKLSTKGSRTGMAAGEGSGKIDLGALMAEHRQSAAPKAGAGGKSVITIPGIPPKASPIRRYGLVALIAVFAVIGIAAVVKLGLMSVRRGGVPGASGITEAEEKAKENEMRSEIIASLEKQAHEKELEGTAKSAGAAEAEAAEGDEEISGAEPGHAARHKKKKGFSGGGEEMEAAPQAVASKGSGGGQEAPTAPEDKGKKDLMSLLDSATTKKKAAGVVMEGEGEKGAKGQKKEGSENIPSVEELMGEGKAAKKVDTSTAGLPATLNKNEIRAVMKKFNPQIMKCGEGKVGTLILNLVVNNDGTVKSAKASGQFANDPAGKCAEKIALTAKFPPFKNPSMNVTYPYVFAPPPGT